MTMRLARQCAIEPSQTWPLGGVHAFASSASVADPRHEIPRDEVLTARHRRATLCVCSHPKR